MSEFFSFLKVFMVCGTIFSIATLVLMAMPQSKLRSVGLEISKWALACGLLLLVPSPIDVVPDVLPVLAWVDDAAYIVCAIGAAKGAMGERKRRTLMEEIELEQMATNGRSPHTPPVSMVEDQDIDADSDQAEAA